MAEEEAPPERPTQRLVSRAADPHPLNRLPVGLQSEDELDDDLLLAQAVENYVGTHLHSTLKELLAASDPHAHYPVHLTFFYLCNHHQLLADYLIKRPLRCIAAFDAALKKMQEKVLAESPEQDLVVKEHCHTRLSSFFLKYITFKTVPGASDYGHLVNFFVRTGQVKLLEYERKMQCTKCKYQFSIFADLEQRNAFPKLETCPNRDKECTSKNFVLVDGTSFCRDFQDIRLQERVDNVGVGAIPRSVLAILQDDLVDSLQAGDSVEVTGIPMRRWRPLNPGQKADIETFILANNVVVTNSLRQQVQLTPDMQAEFEQHWQAHAAMPMLGRDLILKAVCPQIYGLSLVKLALILVLIGGVPRQEKDGLKVRSQSHLLLVGDPGTGKSQFLKYAARLSTRSVLTTGVGTTSAGLTVAAVKEQGGDWMLEAGALVLADGGVCCIDEFNSISAHDRQAIHEAMEQQTISVAKAGLVCKLNTRCSVVAATNPKGRFDLEQSLTVNTSLASPLISRFDLILVLLDKRNDEWDQKVSAFVLQEQSRTFKAGPSIAADCWQLEKLKLYINYVRSRFEPRLSPDAERVLITYFQRQRAADSRNAARTTIRLLESLIRVAQAHARLMFRNTVEVRDAVVAITLVDSSNQNQPILRELQGVAQSTFPDDPDEAYARQEHLVLRSLGLADDAHDPIPPSPPSSPVVGARVYEQPQPPPQQRPPKPTAAAAAPQSVQQSPAAGSSAVQVVTTTQVDEEAPSAEPRDFAQHSPLSNDHWWRAQPVPLTGSQLSSALPVDAPAAAAVVPSSQRRVAFADVAVASTTAAKRPSTDVPSAATQTAAKTPRLEKLSPPTGATASQVAKAAASLLDNLDALEMEDAGSDVLLSETATVATPKPNRGKFLED